MRLSDFISETEFRDYLNSGRPVTCFSKAKDYKEANL
jgi:hypothetical protein